MSNEPFQLWPQLSDDIKEIVLSKTEPKAIDMLACTAKAERDLVRKFWKHCIEQRFGHGCYVDSVYPKTLYMKLNKLHVQKIWHEQSSFQNKAKEARLASKTSLSTHCINFIKFDTKIPASVLDYICKKHIALFTDGFTAQEYSQFLITHDNQLMGYLAHCGFTQSLAFLLDKVETPKEQKKLLMTGGKRGRTAVHKAGINNQQKVLKLFFDYFPHEQDRLELLCCGDDEHMNVLHLKATVNASDEVLAIINHLTLYQSKKTLIFSRDKKSNTPFMWAVSYGHLELFKTFLACFDDEKDKRELMFATNNNNSTVLHIAAMKKRTNLVKVLLNLLEGQQRLAYLTQKDAKYQTVFHLAAARGLKGMLSELCGFVSQDELFHILLLRDHDGLGPLNAAIGEGYLATALQLVRGLTSYTHRKALLMCRDNGGFTALDSALVKGLEEITINGLRKSGNSTKWQNLVIDLVNTLDSEADKKELLSQMDHDGNLVIHAIVMVDLKIMKGSLQFAIKLLNCLQTDAAKKHILLLRYKKGNTVFHELLQKKDEASSIALLNCLSSFEHKKDLLSRGTRSGKTIIYEWIMTGDIKSAQAFICWVKTPEERKEILFIEDDFGKTIFHDLAKKGDCAMFLTFVNHLLIDDKKALLLKQDCHGQTLLYLAVAFGHHAQVKALFPSWTNNDDKKNMMSLADKTGETAMHLAVRRNYPAILQTLLEHLPEFKDKISMLLCKDLKGNTPFGLAIASENIDCVKIIFSHLGINSFDLLEATDVKLETKHIHYLYNDVVVPWIKDNYMNAIDKDQCTLIQKYKDTICKALCAQADADSEGMLPVLQSTTREGSMLHSIFATTSASKGPYKIADSIRCTIMKEEQKPWNYRDILKKIDQIEQATKAKNTNTP